MTEAWVLAHASERAPEHGRLLERVGFTTARHFTTLVADLRRAGLDRVVRDVDTENPTGALGVYTRLGFVATAQDAAYRVVHRPGGPIPLRVEALNPGRADRAGSR